MLWHGRQISFTNGLWLIGKGNTSGELYSACSEFTSEWTPGKILDTGIADDPYFSKYRVYSIGNSYPLGYKDWPISDGAPVDIDGNPLILGSQTHWYVINDLNVSNHENLWNTSPLGVEAQFTFFGVDSIPGLENVMFVKVLFIFKNIPENLDSLTISLWNDVDLGSANDDYFGCDTSLDMVYFYNGDDFDKVFGSKIPAIGYQLLQGPMVESTGDTARFLDREIPDYKNLRMTSSVFYVGASPNYGDPENATEAFNNSYGLSSGGSVYIDPTDDQPTPFLLPGDPITGTGWTADDLLTPEDERGILSCGPFYADAELDSQEVIFAVIVGNSSNQYGGIISMRHTAELTRQVFESNFTNFKQELNLIHRPVNLHFSNGSFEAVVLAQPTGTNTIDKYGTNFYYALDDETTFHRKDLVNYVIVPTPPNTNGEFFKGLIANDGVEHRIRYYFEFDGPGEVQYSYPLAAPEVWFESIFGPDNTPPTVTAELENYTTVFTTGNRTLSGIFSYEDRFPVGSTFVQLRKNDGQWVSFPATVTLRENISIYNNMGTKINAEWQCDISWSNLHFGDTLHYRIAVKDSSANRNTGYSSEYFIRMAKEEDIDHFSDYSAPLRDTIVTFWDFDGWSLWALYSAPEHPNWAIPDSTIKYGRNLNTTLTYRQPIPLVNYTTTDLLLYHVMSINVNDTAFFEYSTDKSSWTTLIAHTNERSTNYNWDRINLKPAVNADTVWFRFRFVSDDQTGANNIGWRINIVKLIVDSTVVVGIDPSQTAPDKFMLYPAYPNPFNPVTTLAYDLPKVSNVSLKIYNIAGQQIFQKSWKNQPAASYQYQWNASNFASGLYFVRLQAGAYQKTQKMLLIK